MTVRRIEGQQLHPKSTIGQGRTLPLLAARALLAAGLLLTAVYLSVLAGQAKNRANAVRPVAIYLETPLSAADADALRKEAGDTAFSVWGGQTDVTVADPDLGRRAQTDVLTFCGPCEPVLPLSAGLDAADTDGCLIGEQTAWELFGSTQVVGDEILIGDEIRTVRAVLRLPQSVVVIHENPGGSESPCYNRITLAGGQEADGETFLMQHALAGSVLRFDCLSSAHWLAELVPGKWSDFLGWKENIKQKRKDFALLSSIQKNCVELYYESQCLAHLWNALLAAVCVVVSAVNFAGIIPFDNLINKFYNIFTTVVR